MFIVSDGIVEDVVNSRSVEDFRDNLEIPEVQTNNRNMTNEVERALSPTGYM
jgi:hypothetical protein